MAHTPQHPDNPCSLDENEQTPAKIWELLRRNGKFQRAVNKLQRLDAAARTDPTIGPAWFAGYSLVKTLKQHHAFAGHALEWLVPEPLFRVSKVAIPIDVDLTGKNWVALGEETCFARRQAPRSLPLPNPQNTQKTRFGRAVNNSRSIPTARPA